MQFVQRTDFTGPGQVHPVFSDKLRVAQRRRRVGSGTRKSNKYGAASVLWLGPNEASGATVGRALGLGEFLLADVLLGM